jgi:hypothetical protein
MRCGPYVETVKGGRKIAAGRRVVRVQIMGLMMDAHRFFARRSYASRRMGSRAAHWVGGTAAVD